jgi:hypothetical protein
VYALGSELEIETDPTLVAPLISLVSYSLMEALVDLRDSLAFIVSSVEQPKPVENGLLVK